MITMLSRSVIWADLCLLSRRLCNLPANKAKYWHLYVASNSMSPRLVLPSDAMPNHVVPDEEYDNEWRGYSREAHLNQVTWYTAGENPSSLQAVKRAGPWTLAYVGPRQGNESIAYLKAFALAGLSPIEPVSLRRPLKLINFLRSRATDHFARELAADANTLLRLADTLEEKVITMPVSARQ